MARPLGLMLALALVAAACTGDDPVIRGAPPEDTQESTSPRATPDAGGGGGDTGTDDGSAAGEREPEDRIVVQTAEGQLLTVLPDGSDPLPLTEPDAGLINTHPTWAPDGSRLAWAEALPDGADSAVVSARFDRSGELRFETEAAPFYLAWDPSSTRVGYLQQGLAGVNLGLVDIVRELPSRILDRGEPYWFSWGPGGDEVLVHASGIRLDRVELDGSAIVIDEAPGPFQAPTWTSVERAFVYADEEGGSNFLVTTGAEGEGRQALATYDGYLTFVVNADASRVALQVTEPPPDDGVVTASFQPDEPDSDIPPDVADVIDQYALHVIPIYGGLPDVVTDEPVEAFFWSPAGDVLAYLVQITVDGEPWLEWRFWDSFTQFPGPRFQPSEVLAGEYLPSFDQHAQSVSYWAPDGSALVYAGTDPSGEEGIWVVPAERGGQPTKIADGVFAAWSPLDVATAGRAIH